MLGAPRERLLKPGAGKAYHEICTALREVYACSIEVRSLMQRF